MTKIIYQGEWDGQRIWRKQTIAEQLLEEIEKNKKLSNKHIDNCNGCALCEL